MSSGGKGIGLHHARLLARSVPLILLLLLANACQIKLVSDYDENFVKAATSAQKEITALLQNLRNPPIGYDVSYQANIAKYNEIRTDLNGLLVLADSHQNNEATVAQVNSLIAIVNGLEKIHRSGPPSPTYLDQKQEDINAAFSYVIRTENDKKPAT